MWIVETGETHVHNPQLAESIDGSWQRILDFDAQELEKIKLHHLFAVDRFIPKKGPYTATDLLGAPPNTCSYPGVRVFLPFLFK